MLEFAAMNAADRIRERLASLEAQIHLRNQRVAEQLEVLESQRNMHTEHISKLMETSDREEERVYELFQAVQSLDVRLLALESRSVKEASESQEAAAVVATMCDIFFDMLQNGKEIDPHEHLEIFSRFRELTAAAANPDGLLASVPN